MAVHRIRLRGPWEVRPHSSEPTGQMAIPGTLRDGGWPGLSGRVSFYRRFGRPSNLGPNESVWLLFERLVGAVEIRLNNEAISPAVESQAYEITDRLAERNRLEVVLDVADDQGGLVGEVVLEIRSTNDAETR